MEDYKQQYNTIVRHVCQHADHYLSATKTGGVVFISYCVALVSPSLLRWSVVVSPIFTAQIIFVTTGLMYMLWKLTSSDINSTVIRATKLTVSGIRTFWKDYLALGSSNGDPRNDPQYVNRVANRRVVRILVMFVMMQNCLQPDFPIFMLLFFIYYITKCDHLKLKHTEFFDLMSSLPFIGEHVPVDHTSAGRPDLEPETANETDEDIEHITVRKKVLKLFKNHIRVIQVVTKISISVIWVWYFVSYSKTFAFCINIYLSVTCAWLEHQLISMMLAFEIDGGILEICEGLEQYYIAGIFTIVDLLLTFIFMVWVLQVGRPILMLIALYTNVYCTGHDMFNFIVTPAAYERAFLAKFQMVSGSDLGENEDACPICLAYMGIARRTRCGHSFHGHCLRKLVSHGRPICPMCRSNLS